MQNNFNDTINDLKDFSLTPSNNVWKEIESNLDEKKKRRIVGWWWSLPMIGIFAFGLLYFGYRKDVNKLDINRNVVENSSINEVSDILRQLPEPRRQVSESLSQVPEPRRQVSKSRRQVSKSRRQVSEPRRQVSEPRRQVPEISRELSDIRKEGNKSIIYVNNSPISTKNTSQYLKENDNNNLKLNNIDKSYQNIASTNTNAIRTEIDLATMVNNSPYLNNVQQDTSQKKNILDSVKSVAKETSILKSKQPKKLLFSIAFGGGINYVSNNNIFGKDENTNLGLNNLATQPATSSPGQISNNNMLPLPKTGFSFSVGVNASYTLSKKWTLQTGIAYKYLQNKIGLKEDSVAFYPAYYYLSDKEIYTNYSNQIEIPINISYCLNPNSKNKISIQTGLNIAWIFKDNWLNKIDDIGRYQTFVEQNKRVLFELQTGAAVNFNNKFSVSLLAQKSITPIQKSSSKYYWQQLNIQFSVPLRK